MLEKIIPLINKSNEENKYLKLNTPFSEISNFYYFTNENIKDFFDLLDFTNDTHALTVCGSGDQVLNLINKGVKNIDVFDSNKLAFYFLFGIKIPALQCFSYTEYQYFFKMLLDENIDKKLQYSYFLKLKGFMNKDFFEFWNSLFLNSITQNHTLSIFKILAINEDNLNIISLINNYYESEESYEQTKENLKTSNIRYKVCDVFEVHNYFNLKYDKIFLSNIFDYIYKTFGFGWNYDDVKPLVEKNLISLLKDDGELILGYLFKHYSFKRNSEKTNLFSCSNTTKEDFVNYKILNFSTLHNNEKSPIVGDSVIITRK